MEPRLLLTRQWRTETHSAFIKALVRLRREAVTDNIERNTKTCLCSELFNTSLDHRVIGERFEEIQGFEPAIVNWHL